jgi:hypothetical protein
MSFKSRIINNLEDLEKKLLTHKIDIILVKGLFHYNIGGVGWGCVFHSVK